jgi:hypothetical protein
MVATLPLQPSCPSQSIQATFPMSKTGVSLGSLSTVAMIITFAPAFKQTRNGFIKSDETIRNSSVTEEQLSIFAVIGYTTGFWFCNKLLSPLILQLPFVLPLVVVYYPISVIIGGLIGAFSAPVLLRPVQIIFWTVWHPCCGLAEDFQEFFKWTNKHFHRTRRAK